MVHKMVVALVLGPRTGFSPEHPSWNTEARPHSIPLAVIGAAIAMVRAHVWGWRGSQI